MEINNFSILQGSGSGSGNGPNTLGGSFGEGDLVISASDGTPSNFERPDGVRELHCDSIDFLDIVGYALIVVYLYGEIDDLDWYNGNPVVMTSPQKDNTIKVCIRSNVYKCNITYLNENGDRHSFIHNIAHYN